MSRSPNSDQTGPGVVHRGECGSAACRDRKTYEPPKVACFGKVGKLAQFGGSQVVDSGGGLGNPRDQRSPPFPSS